MKIFLHEITDQETELDFNQDDQWVANAVFQVDEKTEDSPQFHKTRPIQSHFSLRKVDDVIVVSGKIETHIELVCSRCANSFRLECRPNFSALFCKDPIMAGVAHLQRPTDGSNGPKRPMGQNQGFARHAHNEELDTLSGSQDLDITYLSNDYIDLAEVLTEQLQFQIPFQPLCQENCKGICSQCGADFNRGRCACAKTTSSQAFSVLRDFKVE